MSRESPKTARAARRLTAALAIEAPEIAGADYWQAPRALHALYSAAHRYSLREQVFALLSATMGVFGMTARATMLASPVMASLLAAPYPCGPTNGHAAACRPSTLHASWHLGARESPKKKGEAMELFLLFLCWIVFAALVGWYASTRGRSGVGFFFLSLLVSPLIGFLIALIVVNKPATGESRR